MFIVTDSGSALNSKYIIQLYVERFDDVFHIMAQMVTDSAPDDPISGLGGDEYSIYFTDTKDRAMDALKHYVNKINV